MPEFITMRPRDEIAVISEGNGAISRDTVKFVAPLTAELPAGSLLDLTTDSTTGELMALPAMFTPADAGTGSPATVNADAILLRHAPVGATHAAALTRYAEVDANGLIWPSGTDAAGEKSGIAFLASNGIIVR